MKRAVQVVIAAMAAGAMSGCAGQRYTQELKRLQSQVGMLDERVTQLERVGGASPMVEAPVEPAAEPAAIHVKAKDRTSKGAAASIKPSTREIQQALKNAGFYQGSVDGKMGQLTKEAVKEFQRVHGLTDDGIVGKKTWAKLGAYATLSSGEPSAAEVLK